MPGAGKNFGPSMRVLGISAPPITYKIGDKQYLALLVGWGGAFAGVGNKNLGWDYNRHTRRLIVFALDGRAKVPSQPAPFFPQPLMDSGFVVQAALAEKGKQLYWQCFNCHGASVEAKGMAPDLRASPIVVNGGSFAAVVRGGVKGSMGMPVFSELTDEDLLALRHFIRQRARESRPVNEAKTTGF
jgi:quinohemoprotein ethanol dehydrogenase